MGSQRCWSAEPNLGISVRHAHRTCQPIIFADLGRRPLRSQAHISLDRAEIRHYFAEIDSFCFGRVRRIFRLVKRAHGRGLGEFGWSEGQTSSTRERMHRRGVS